MTRELPLPNQQLELKIISNPFIVNNTEELDYSVGFINTLTNTWLFPVTNILLLGNILENGTG